MCKYYICKYYLSLLKTCIYRAPGQTEEVTLSSIIFGYDSSLTQKRESRKIFLPTLSLRKIYKHIVSSPSLAKMRTKGKILLQAIRVIRLVQNENSRISREYFFENFPL